jgi:hypothetical protein
LIANWFEERVHRDNKGVGRAVTKVHQPKLHEQLLTTDNFNCHRPEDDTKYRVLGDTSYNVKTTENYQ